MSKFSLSELDAVLGNLGISLSDETQLNDVPPGLGAFGLSSATIQELSSSQIVLSGISPNSADPTAPSYTLEVNGSGMGLTGLSMGGSSSVLNILSHASGTVNNIQLFAGTASVSPILTVVFTATQLTITTPDAEFAITGTNLPTTLSVLASIANDTYSAGAIGISDIAVFNTNNTTTPVANVSITATSVTISEGPLTIVADGSFSTSFTPDNREKTDLTIDVTSLTITSGSSTIFTASGTAAANAFHNFARYFFAPTQMREDKFDFTDFGESDVIYRSTSNGVTSLTIVYDPENAEGFGPLSTTVTNSLGTGFTAVKEGFFDGSGAANLVTANAVTGAIDILTGASLGAASPVTTFASQTQIGTAPYGWWVAAAGDFFDDGLSELVFRNTETDQIALWETNGTSLLASQVIASAPNGWVIDGTGYFYGDGYADLLWVNEATNQLAIWQMQGTSIVSETVLANSIPNGWRVQPNGAADFFGDGMDGILFRNLETGQVAIWQMDGSSVVSTAVLSETMSDQWRIAEFGNFTGADGSTATDGILWQNVDTGAGLVWNMDGTTIVSTQTVSAPSNPGNDFAGLGSSPQDVGSYFFPNYLVFADSTSGILWQNTSSGQFAVWEMSDGKPITSEELLVTSAIPSGWQIVGMGVFYAYDGEAIVWQNANTGQAALWSVNGNDIIGTDTFASNIPSGWLIAGLGDFFGTGQDDLLWRNDTTGQTAIWEMNGQSILGETLIGGTVPSGWEVAGVADFAGTGRGDILWQNTSTGQVAVWVMSGTNIQSQTIIATAPSGWTIAGVGDFDGGITPEILWQNTSAGELAVWKTNGTSLTGSSIIATGVPFNLGWSIAAVGNYTGGTQDSILWQNSTTGQVAEWNITSAGVSGASVVAGGVPSGWTVAANPVLRA